MSSTSSSQPLGIARKGDVIAGCGAETAMEDQYARWKCIYPNYIDKCKSVKEGRRLTVNRAVDRPCIAEMIEICQKYSIPFVAENKAYSRDWLTRGRLRVNLNAVANEELNTKTKLMLLMGKEIPGLKSRAERLAKEASHLASLERMQEKEAKKASKKKK